MTKPKTATAAQKVIKKIMNQQAIKQARSEYDKSVCITAVSAACDIFESVEVCDPVGQYVEAVYQAISNLQDGYNDSDGEYTNGKAPIGDVLGAVYDFRKTLEE